MTLPWLAVSLTLACSRAGGNPDTGGDTDPRPADASSGPRGEISLTSADRAWYGAELGMGVAWDLEVVGDWDGDGAEDALIAGPWAGAVYRISGTEPGGTLGVDAGTAMVHPEVELPGWSLDAAGDVDGDGRADAIVGHRHCCLERGELRSVPLIAASVIDASSSALDDGLATLTSETWGTSTYADFVVAGPGDLDGDGLAELVVDVEGGGLRLLRGPVEGTVALATAPILIEGGDQDLLWGPARAGDTDGDGLSELLVSSWTDKGALVSLVADPPDGEHQIADLAMTRLTGTSFGHAAGDLDGDGHDDLVLASEDHADDVYTIFVFLGPLSGDLGPDDATASIEGERLWSGQGAGDVDGDGAADLLFFASPSQDSQAGLMYGPIEGARTWSDVDAYFLPESPSFDAGAALSAGDLDGDGFSDLLIGDPGWTSDSQEDDGEGAAYAVLGGP